MHGGTSNSQTKGPSPNYEEIQEKAEIDMLKIGSYFRGKTEYEIEEKSRKKESGIKSKQEQFLDKSKEDACMAVDHILPLVDCHAQGALRRRIVHDQLDRV